MEFTATPLVLADGAVGAVVCFRNITERREMQKRVNEFYSIVSHELRTPLTSIRGALGLLEGGKGGELSPKGKRLVEVGRGEADRLVRLINDILDIRKIEEGKFELRATDIEVKELVERTIILSEELARGDGHVDVESSRQSSGIDR